MDKRGKIAIFSVLFIVAILVLGIVIAKPGERGLPECKDGSDNDGDGYTDWPDDPGCSSKNDKSELNPEIECDDGSDNDGDSNTDYPDDSGCTSPSDDDETDCGDEVCEGGEDCDNCVADCLGVGQVCCNGVAYDGDCCDDNDCTLPETCVDYTCQIVDSCSDTDYGSTPELLGSVSGYSGGSPYNYTDYCVDNETVMEYYCSGAQWSSDQISCVYNFTYCANGACT